MRNVGKTCDHHKCQTLPVDNLEEVVNKDSADLNIEDWFIGEEELEDRHEKKCLGDVISHDGRNIKNIKTRVKKGTCQQHHDKARRNPIWEILF